MKPKTSSKVRIDQLLVQRGLAPSRHRAQALVMSGLVLVDEQRVEKSSQCFPENAAIRLKGKDHPYVSRGGVKLEGALEHFAIQVAGKICLDVGASTGGFTDCLLQRGASRVYAFDTGSGQLHESLRQDPRVILKERLNVRYLRPEDLPETVQFVVVDVSFISLRLIVPALISALRPRPWEGLLLVKPQFEASPSQVGKGGVIRDEALRQEIVLGLKNFVESLGLATSGPVPAVLAGESGNQEYFLLVKCAGD